MLTSRRKMEARTTKERALNKLSIYNGDEKL